MKSIILSLVLLIPGSAFSQTSNTPANDAQPAPKYEFLDRTSHAAMWFTLAADAGTTWYGIKKDNKEEANPIVTKLSSRFHPGQRMIVESSIAVGLTAGGDCASHWLLRNGHPKLMLFVRGLIIGTHTLAVFNNMQ